jgi:hypothetical protein
MRALFGEIVLGWHRATRGPLMASFIAAAILLLVALPGVNDPGLIYTGYGLGLFWALTLFTSLWCGGTAYALDSERHRLALTFTKPLHRLTLWWGRWFAVWLPLVVAITFACVLLAFRAIPEGHFVYAPRLPDLREAAVTELERLRSLNRVPPGISEARLLHAVKDELQSRYSELRPDIPRTYHFDIPATLPGAPMARLRLSGSPFPGAKDALDLAATVTLPSGQKVEVKPERLLDTGMTIALPKEAIHPGQPLTVQLHRRDHVGAASVIYREYHDLHLLLPGRAPWVNLAYFGTLLILTTALTTALGVALGCMFSLPVTLFTGVLALLACSISILSPSISAVDSATSIWTYASTLISETLANPFGTLVELNPLNALLEGEALRLNLIAKFTSCVVLPALLLCSTFSLFSAVKDEDK